MYIYNDNILSCIFIELSYLSYPKSCNALYLLGLRSGRIVLKHPTFILPILPFVNYSYICNMPTINRNAKQSRAAHTHRHGDHQGRSYYHAGYQTKQWRAMRRDILQAQPLCVECGKQGRLTVANVIDHIKPVRLGGEFWDTKNMQPLCTPCHNSKSAKERHGNPVGGEKYSHEGDQTHLSLCPMV